MKRRRLPPILFLLVLALLSLAFRRHLSLPLGGASRFAVAGDADSLLRRLTATDAGADQVLAEAEALLANVSVSTFPSIGNHHRLLYLRVPHRPNATSPPRQRTVSRLRVPFRCVPGDAAFRASLRGFLLARQRQHHRHRHDEVAGAMADLPALLLGRRWRAATCAVVGNSGILLGARWGAQIDAHDVVIRLNNARVAGFTRDVGSRTDVSFVNSNILHHCAVRSAITTPGCGSHPYGRAVPLAMYVCQPAHLLDALVCNATATPESPFPLLLTEGRSLCVLYLFTVAPVFSTFYRVYLRWNTT